jgi:hypothetical protein
MPEYRFYKIKHDGHIAGPAIVQECACDEDALKEAKQFLNGHDVEVWQGARVVAYLVPDDK